MIGGRRLPLSEAAQRLRVSYQTARNWLLEGRLTGGRDEFGRLYVEEAAVDRLLKAQRRQSP